MKFAQTVVSESGFRDAAHNPRRLAALSELLRRLVDGKVKLVALPGGYLTVPQESDVVEAAAEVADMAERVGLTVIGGTGNRSPHQRTRHRFSVTTNSGSGGASGPSDAAGTSPTL